MFNGMKWTELKRDEYDRLGLLPQIILNIDPRPVKEQVADRYAHGGGWHPFGQGKWKFDPVRHTLKYPGDPVFHPYWVTEVRDETVYVYQSGIVAVVQKDGSFEVTRMD